MRLIRIKKNKSYIQFIKVKIHEHVPTAWGLKFCSDCFKKSSVSNLSKETRLKFSGNLDLQIMYIFNIVEEHENGALARFAIFKPIKRTSAANHPISNAHTYVVKSTFFIYFANSIFFLQYNLFFKYTPESNKIS